MNLPEAAAFLAQQWPVFPTDARKRPLTAHGFKDATRDPDEARLLFRHAEGIGMPTGVASGLVAVDIDVKEGRDGLEWLAANEHRMPRTRRHRTQSGGFHLLFLAPPGRNIRNSASKLAPGVDVRGEGGYIVVPPSPGYGVTDDAMPAEVPAWLLALLDPPKPAPAPVSPPRPYRPSGDASAYGTAALDQATAAILNAPDGAKHDTLNREAFSIGGLVSAGEIPEGEARAALDSALYGIRARCEDYHAAQKTLGQAFRDGMAQPRNVPQRLVRRTVEEYAPRNEPPPRDAPPEYWMAEPDSTPDDEPITGQPAANRAGRVLPFISFADAAPSLDANDFVEGVLSRSAMSVIYGESNSGKTFFALDLGLHVAAGEEWRGRAVDQGFVLYLALEGASAISNRIAAFKIENDRLDHRLPFAIAPVAVNLLDPEADADAVIETVKQAALELGAPPTLVIVDTLARAIAGGNENASEDMGALVRNGGLIQQVTGAHLMWIHHSGKDQAKGARGHSSLRAATDTEIEVVATGHARCATVTKQRDMECAGTFPFRLKVIELGMNTRGKAVTSCVVEADDEHAPGGAPARLRLSGHKQRALEVLADLIAHSGRTGDPGVPPGISSVPEKWWRERFYDHAMAGAEQEAKQRAFRRAADELVEKHVVGMGGGRVWTI